MSTEWVSIFISIFVPTIGGVIWIITNFLNNINQKLDKNQKSIEMKIAELEDDLVEKIEDEIKKQSSDNNYNLKDLDNKLTNEINHLNHLISNIEQRFIDRSKFARVKWQNLNQILNNIIRFMEKKGYVSRDVPLDGADVTLSDKGDVDESAIY